MIRIESVTIKDFRGIRDLTLKLNGKTFAICGPNGTGKSGVVDALEFALTGSLSRLSGEGRGDISLKDHGPHVDSRNAPDKATVKVRVTIPALGKTVEIERTVKRPKLLRVAPEDPAAVAVLKQVEAHPEVVLSRRELIKYVLATPGKRAQEVQALLHLDQVEQVRAVLLKLANGAERVAKLRSGDVDTAKMNLLKALDIPMLSSDRVLAAANAQRTILGLPSMSDLTETTSLRDGLLTAAPASAQRIPKTQALEDITAARDALAELAGPATAAAVQAAKAAAEEIASDPTLSTGVTLENFYSTGLKLLTAEACPFCDSAWTIEELRAHVHAKLDHLKRVAHKRRVAEHSLTPLVTLLRRAQASVDTVVTHANKATPPLPSEAMQDFVTACITATRTLLAFLPIADSMAVLARLSSIPAQLQEEIGVLQKAVQALPDPSKADTARVWLIVAQEKLDAYRDARRAHKTAVEQAALARRVSAAYAAASDGVLSGVYATVQEDFASLYAFVNREDEKTFSAKLVPSMGKLGFDVDFYGRGYFPPGAYHSEGHQDGMGVCLYLALMRHLHGIGFTFAILDDVLMSVDAGHRREVCALLKKEFPDTQFIMTTHDPIWLEHMRTEQLITRNQSVRFRRWDVDRGPTEWHDRDVWEEIETALAVDNVREAASLLRKYLEYVSAELCHRLRVPVVFRSDAQHQLGELLPPVIKQMRDLYSRAKAAANSWNRRDVVSSITAAASTFDTAAAQSKAEQWQVNASIHFNEWENLTSADFVPVVRAFRELLSAFACGTCEQFLRVTPEREAPEVLLCECGRVTLKLQAKP